MMRLIKQGAGRKNLYYGTGIFFFAFLIRFIYLTQIKSSYPLFDFPFLDCNDYHRWAKNIILKGPWFGPTAYWKPPLYPYFLAVIYKIFGVSIFIARFVQIMLGSFNCVLIWGLARRAFGEKAALAAGVIASLYGPMVYFDCELLSPVLIIFLNLLLLLILTDMGIRPNWAKCFWAGALLGFSALVMPSVLFFIPLVIGVMVVIFWLGHAARQMFLWVAIFILGAALTIAPVALKQYLLDKCVVLVSVNDGINLYIGNNPKADGISTPPIGVEWRRLLKLPEKEGYLNPPQKAVFYKKKVTEFIGQNPLRFIKLTLKRMLFFWTATEMRNNADTYFFMNFSSLGRILIWHNKFFAFPFGVVAPLGLLGVILSLWQRRNKLNLLLIFFILANMAAVSLVFVNARYRMPVIPVVIIFAGYAARWYYEKIKKKFLKPVALSLPALLFFIFLVNVTVPMANEVNAKELYYDYYNMGCQYFKSRNLNKALDCFQKGHKINPAYPNITNMLGETYRRMGRTKEAISYYKMTIGLAPDYGMAHYFLGKTYKKLGQYEQAINELNEAARLDKRCLGAYCGIAWIYDKNIKDPKMAVVYFNKYLEAKPKAHDADAVKKEIKRLTASQ